MKRLLNFEFQSLKSSKRRETFLSTQKEPRTMLTTKTIEQEIYYYIDETTGARIYDTELMLSEFQDKLNQLQGKTNHANN